MKSPPAVSVLITTYNRAHLLPEVLNSFARQTLDRSLFEVIVLDDGSTDGTREVAEGFATQLNLRYSFLPHAGISAAKNSALLLARAPIVLFADDDDVSHPDLLAQHLRTHGEFPAVTDAVLGHTALHRRIAKDPLMNFVTNSSSHLFSYHSLIGVTQLDYTWFWGGRTSCKRELLSEFGAFDPSFTFGAEDIELGYRLSRIGLRVIYNSGAKSEMIRSMTLRDFCARCEMQGKSNLMFWRKHPNDEVLAWANVADLRTRWREVGSRIDLLYRIAHQLDLLVRSRQRHEVEIQPHVLTLLHRSYDRVFAAFRLKGAWLEAQTVAGASPGRQLDSAAP